MEQENSNLVPSKSNRLGCLRFLLILILIKYLNFVRDRSTHLDGQSKSEWSKVKCLVFICHRKTSFSLINKVNKKQVYLKQNSLFFKVNEVSKERQLQEKISFNFIYKLYKISIHKMKQGLRTHDLNLNNSPYLYAPWITSSSLFKILILQYMMQCFIFMLLGLQV